ncbi:GNAT family N-acetyltransferase [Shewanella sp. D64]|nr:GNAT family N-acetyltransferase [Shewanella sp. D64]MEC4738409.1 GNAT family N-acetyltransferase [Shewanella sp. E94]WBJ98241.1 GNAT family N-acetyltransferase [Shewanella sp. MTB7]
MAILNEYRGKGLGSKIIASLTQIAVANGYARVYLDSQKQAIEFYEKLGFTPFGDEYIEANIEHISMEKTLI